LNSVAGNKCVVVFSGYNQRAVIAFLRTLEANGVCYAIIAKSPQDALFLTDYSKHILAIRQHETLVLEDLLSALGEVKQKRRADQYIISPSTEALNRFLLEHRQQFENNKYIIPLVDKNLYELISDKYSFGNLCQDNRILIPREITIDGITNFPVVAKPRRYYSTQAHHTLSPVIIENLQELSAVVTNFNVTDFYFQEFINGKSFYLLYYFSRDGSVCSFSQENLMQQAGGKSIVAAISSDFHQQTESQKYEALFKSIGFFGLVMVEVKQQGESFYMIEANPRCWGPSQLFVDAGVNLFEYFLCDFGVLNKKPNVSSSSDTIRYFWLGGIADTIRNNRKLTYHQGDETGLLATLPVWLESDVYRRADTLNIFRNEVFCWV